MINVGGGIDMGQYSLPEGRPISLMQTIVASLPCLVADSPGFEWASGITGVRHLPLSLEDRRVALADPLPPTSDRDGLHIYITPARGVNEDLALHGLD